MKLSSWTSGMRLSALLFMAVAVAGCPGNDKDKETSGKGAGEIQSQAVTMPKTYNGPASPDPSVSAALGGAGFEALAADSGWQTTSLTPEEFKYIADTNAKKGGEISFAVSEYPATFRAYGKDENTQATRTIYGLVYETLLGINPITLEFLPSLATHWKVGADGQTYYFRINPQAQFSDGYPVTSEDVIATYKLGSDPGILQPYTNTFFGGFEAPVAVSKYIVSVRSKEKNWKNMFYFAGTPILPAHVIGTIDGKTYLDKYQYEMPPGTGPYVVRNEDIKKGNSVTVTRRSDWWGSNLAYNRGTYNFDKIKMVVVRDENLMLEKFKNGEIDLYPVARASYWVEKFKFDEVNRGLIQRQKIYNNNPVGFGGIAFNTKRPPFNDPKLRQAITLLFNRKDLVAKLMFNEYELSDSYYPNSVYANPNNPKQEYNPEKAGQILAEAGYTQRNNEGILVKNGQPLSIDMLVTQDQIRIVTPFQQDLQKAGIKVNFRTVDATTRFKMITEKNYSMSFMQWGGIIYPNPISSFHSNLAGASTSSNNITGFANARADELIDREQVTFDQAERVKILRELDSILVAENTYALAYHAPHIRIAYWNKFGMPEYTIGRISDWDAAFAQWWYDADKAATVKKGRSDKSVKMEIAPLENRYWTNFDKQRQQTAAAPSTTGSNQ